jgi:cation/acetate symporter
MSSGTEQVWPLAIIAGVLASFILVGLFNKSRAGEEYGFGGRFIGRIGSGAAIASNWMSAASFLGIAGILYLKGYLALAYVIGWTGGYVLLLVLLSGQLRRFGKHTAPEFVGERYESSSARLISAVISIAISVIYCVAQFKGIGLLFAWLFAIDYVNGVTMGAAVVVAYIVFSGMLGVSRNQQMQYFVLIVSFILPLMFLAHKMGYFWLFPQFGYGQAIEDLSSNYGINLAVPYASASLYQWTSLCFTLMVGTAGLPHVLSRFYVVPNIREARWSLVWGLFFIALIYWSAPAYGVFARLLELQGNAVPDPATARSMADMVVINTAIKGGLPPWLIGILAAGAISAAFFTVAGLLMTGAASVSFDIYSRIIDKKASEARKMAVAKSAVIFLAVLVLILALKPPGLIVEIIAVAFALAGNTIFPVFLLGIWWGRTNRQGAIAGMLSGCLITFAEPLFGGVAPVIAQLFPITSSAMCGAPLVIAVMIVVSLLTPPPSDEMRRFLAEEVHGHLD